MLRPNWLELGRLLSVVVMVLALLTAGWLIAIKAMSTLGGTLP